MVLLELQANVGKRLSRRLQEWKGKDGHQAVRHANGHDPGRSLDGMKNVYSGAVDLLEQDLAMLVERLARFCDRNALRRAFQQRRAKLIFERPQAFAEGGLGDAKPLRRFAHAPRLDHAREIAQFFEIQACSSALRLLPLSYSV